ncbi:hypothetical protein Zmor_003485 [Zophobas morio]|uniref:Uncharacterized protein n=1 Tax=Zophobas morio TaxID=2755281 RepID=A0AA38HSD9_9CUCU|nr:hypothetical protein Zmor_003485 [Zophobas morio]
MVPITFLSSNFLMAFLTALRKYSYVKHLKVRETRFSCITKLKQFMALGSSLNSTWTTRHYLMLHGQTDNMFNKNRHFAKTEFAKDNRDRIQMPFIFQYSLRKHSGGS